MKMKMTELITKILKNTNKCFFRKKYFTKIMTTINLLNFYWIDMRLLTLMIFNSTNYRLPYCNLKINTIQNLITKVMHLICR